MSKKIFLPNHPPPVLDFTHTYLHDAQIFFGQLKICKIEAEFVVRVIKFCQWIFVKNQGLKCSPWKCANTKHVLAVLVPRVGTGYCSSIEGRDSAVGITTVYGLDGPGIDSQQGVIFPVHPDWPWGQPSLLHNGYRVFAGVKRLGCGVDHPPPLAPRLK
jgi:hypothetical protein